MEGRAPAPLAMRIAQLFDAGLDTRAPQRLRQQAALPLRIGLERQRLHRASAAAAKIAAKRRDAVGTWRPDFDQISTGAVDLRDDGLAGQGIGDEHDPSGPVATPSPRVPSLSILSRALRFIAGLRR